MEKKSKHNPDAPIRRETVVCEGLHLREEQDGRESRTIEGYAILFNTPSAVLWCDDADKLEAREIIAPEAVTRELLDTSDIKFTLFHDRQLILARSNHGAGTLSYKIDERGVAFSFEAPHTADGEKALELVRRGDLAGCSFAFSTYYNKRDYVGRDVTTDANGTQQVTYTVRRMLGVHDMTLAADPAYPDTSVSLRELLETPSPPTSKEGAEACERQLAEMSAILQKYKH